MGVYKNTFQSIFTLTKLDDQQHWSSQVVRLLLDFVNLKKQPTVRLYANCGFIFPFNDIVNNRHTPKGLEMAKVEWIVRRYDQNDSHWPYEIQLITHVIIVCILKRWKGSNITVSWKVVAKLFRRVDMPRCVLAWRSSFRSRVQLSW